MDWKIFFSTFVLIFLAELGDKTQLATMGAAATSRSPVSVMLGAITALIVSSVAAVLVGMVFSRHLPEKAIKIAAGIVFLVFAVLYFREGFSSEKKESPEVSGAAAGINFYAAREFEAQEHRLFLDMAGCAQNPALRELFLAIASEEAVHLHRLKKYEPAPQEEKTGFSEKDTICFQTDTGADNSEDKDKSLLRQALLHEEKMASFYEALAEKTAFSSLEKIFVLLAEEEQAHAARIQTFLDSVG